MVRWLWQPGNSQLAISSITPVYLPAKIGSLSLKVTPRQLLCLTSHSSEQLKPIADRQSDRSGCLIDHLIYNFQH